LLRFFSITAVITVLLFSSPALVLAQSSAATDNGAVQNSSCSVLSLQTTANLTFKQRNCYFARQLLSPMNAASVVAFGVVEKLRNSPVEKHSDWSTLPHRIETHYARQSARDAAEMLVGYWHHEDPRPRKSSETSFFRRTNSAFLSVLTSPGEDGRLRPALAPMAGSLSSAFVGSAMYTRKDTTISTTMVHAGMVYSFYFVRALFTEFKPDIDSLAHHILNR